MSVCYPNYEWLLPSQAKNLKPNKTKEQNPPQVQGRRASSNKSMDRIFQTNSIKASNKITINFAMTGVGMKRRNEKKKHNQLENRTPKKVSLK